MKSLHLFYILFVAFAKDFFIMYMCDCHQLHIFVPIFHNFWLIKMKGTSGCSLDAESLDTEFRDTEFRDTESLDTESLGTEFLGTEFLDTESLDTESLDTEFLDTESLDTESLDTESRNISAIDILSHMLSKQ